MTGEYRITGESDLFTVPDLHSPREEKEYAASILRFILATCRAANKMNDGRTAYDAVEICLFEK